MHDGRKFRTLMILAAAIQYRRIAAHQPLLKLGLRIFQGDISMILTHRVAVAAAMVCAAISPSQAATSQPVPQDPIVTNDPAFMAVFSQQYKVAFGEGAIPAKYKQLSGATLSVVIKCEECLKYHVQHAIKLGATRQEIVEALRIGLLTGGSAGMPTMGAAYVEMDNQHLK
jgi:AhpD family alkylhydroperoxidase